MGNEAFFTDIYTTTDSESISAHYAEWADRYNAAVGEAGYAQPGRAADALVRLNPDRSISVLDVGCGTGLSGLALRAAGYEVIEGCDFSAEMLKRAEETDVYGRLFHADLNQPPIAVEDDAYGAAVVVGVLATGHVQASAVDEIARMVASGGSLVIAVNDHFYQEGLLQNHLASSTNIVEEVFTERGDHLPGLGLDGWVVGLRVL